MKSIIEREATLENNSDIEVKVKKSSRAFVKETHNEARHAQQSNSLDKSSTESIPRNKC